MIAYEIHNTLVEYMTETNNKCSFKVREIENGLYAIELYTCNPGVLIGKSCELVHKYTKILKERDKYFDHFEINEVDGFIYPGMPKITEEQWQKELNDYLMSHGF